MTRRLTLLSGSKLHLASLCAWSFQPGVPQVDVGSKAARAVGIAFHARCAAYVHRDIMVTVASVCADLDDRDTRKVANLFAVWLEKHRDTNVDNARAEATYCFDVETRKVRHLGDNLDRKYEEAGIRPTEIPVTVDLATFGLDGASMPSVIDFKTGAQRDRQGIREHAQLRAGGFCVAREQGVESVRIAAEYYDEDGVETVDAVLDAFDLDAIEEELVALHAAVLASPQPRPGTHCADLWCGAAASCPALVQAAELVREEAAKDPADAVTTTNAAAIRSKEHAAEIHALLTQFAAYEKACWSALDAYVAVHGPIEIANGRIYAAVEHRRESIKLDDAALAALREKLGEHADAAVKVSLTKEAIADATRAMVGAGRQRAALEREVMGRLRELGAVKESTYTSYESMKMRKTEAA